MLRLKKIKAIKKEKNSLIFQYYQDFFEILGEFKLPLILLVLVLFIGTSGYMILSKGDFINSFYMTIITVATIGFGEVLENSNTNQGRIFTSFLAISGIGFYTTSLTVLVRAIFKRDIFYIVKYISMLEQIQKLKNHILIISYNEITEKIISNLKSNNIDFVLLEDRKTLEEKIIKNSYIKYYIIGDIFTKEVINASNIMNAKGAIITLDDRIKRTAVLVSLRLIRPNKDDFYIYVLADNDEEAEKYKNLGANATIIPSKIIATRLSSFILHQTYSFVSELLDRISHGEEKEIDIIEINVDSNSILVNKKIEQLTIRKKFNSTIIAIVRGESLIVSIKPDMEILPGDRIIIFGKTKNLKEIQIALKDNQNLLLTII